MKKKKKAIILTLLLTVLLLPKIFAFFTNFGYDTGRTKTFTSQNGERSVTVKQDFVSRPYVFYEGKRIFAFEGSGFMESVQWSVAFSDENTISLVSDPHIGEYFEIELDNIGSGAGKESQNLLFSLVGGLIFWMSPFCFAYVWKRCEMSKIAQLVHTLSLEEIETLKENQQEPILNRKHCWKQTGKIIKVKQVGNREKCTVLWYSESFLKLPSYENFHCSTVKPTKKEYSQLELMESTLTTLVIMTNKSRRVVSTGFWSRLDA